MKKKYRALALAMLLPTFILAGCKKTEESFSVNQNTNDGPYKVILAGLTVNNGESNSDPYKIYIGDGLNTILPQKNDNSTGNFSFASSDEAVLTVSASGKIDAKKVGTANIIVTDNGKQASDSARQTTVKIEVLATPNKASSNTFSYARVSYDERAKILGQLEKYAVDNYLTGITIFSNGGKVVYNNDAFEPVTSQYVLGYGWGTMREGNMKGKLPNPIDPKYENFYQIGTTSVASMANAMNFNGSDVSDLYGYISSAYYGTRLNEEKNGYEWYPSLALDNNPIAINKVGGTAVDDQNAYSTSWRIHVRNDVYYRTASTKDNIKKYDKRKIEKEDYLTPIKFMLTNWNRQLRGAELIDGISGFNGAASYYSQTTTNNTGDASALWNDDLWKQYMDDNIKMGEDEEGWYIDFNLLFPCTTFYAKYYLSSNLYSPLPESFIKEWGAAALGSSPTNGSATPVDTMLSTGPYYISKWDSNKEIVLTGRNNESTGQAGDYFFTQDVFSDGTKRDVYRLPGIVMYKAGDTSASLKEKFEDGQIVAYTPDKDSLKSTYSADNGTTKRANWKRYTTQGDGNFKINVNSMTDAEAKARFGASGTVTPSAYQKPNYILSQKDFLDFLSFGLDRKTFADSRGGTPTQDYFSNNYQINPEEGVSYNSTNAHKAVLADRYYSSYGYNEAAAKASLKKVLTKIKNASDTEKVSVWGLTKKNPNANVSASNPWVLTVNMNWMNTNDVNDYGDVFNSIKTIFEAESKADFGGNYSLNINQIDGTGTYNDVYNKMKSGQFDLAFGAITGNDLNPLNFMEVLKSDNSSSFTLNWGRGTDVNDNTIVYDGKTWSFDSLWQAADSGIVLNSEGKAAGLSSSQTAISANNETITYEISLDEIVSALGSSEIDKFEYSLSYKYPEYEEKADGSQGSLVGEIPVYIALNPSEIKGANALSNNRFKIVLSNNRNDKDDPSTGLFAIKPREKGKESDKIGSASLTIRYPVSFNGTTVMQSKTLTLATQYGVAQSEKAN